MNINLMQANNVMKSKITVTATEGKMALGGYQSLAPGSDDFASQAVLNGERSRILQSFSSSTAFSKFLSPEESSLTSTAWAAQDDPYEMMDFVQNYANNRNCGHGNGCGSDSDLYGLVSDILEESNEKDSYFADMTPSELASVWSPKSVKKGSQQYLQSGSNVQSVSSFAQAAVYHNLSSRSQVQLKNTDSNQRKELQQHFNGFDFNDQWLFPPTTRDIDSCPLPTRDVQTVTGFLPNSSPGAPDYNAAGKDDGFCPVNSSSNSLHWPVPSGYLSNNMTDKFFNPHSDYSNHNQVKHSRNGQFSVKKEINLVDDMQGLLVTNEDAYSSECQDRPLGQRYYEDHISQQNDFGCSKMQTTAGQIHRFKKELGESFKDYRAPDSVVKMRSLPSAFCMMDFSEYRQHHSGHFPQPDVLPEAFSQLPPFPDKHAMQMPNHTVGYVMEYVPHHSQIIQYPNRLEQLKGISDINPNLLSQSSAPEFFPQDFLPMQRGSEHLVVNGLGVGQNLYARNAESQLGLSLDEFIEAGDDSKCELELENHTPHTSFANMLCSVQHVEGKIKPSTGNSRGGDKKQGFLQNPYLSGSVNGFHRQGRGNRANTSGKIQPSPFLPYIYSVGDLRRTPHELQLNSGDLPARSTLLHSNAAKLMDRCDLLPDSECTSFNPYLPDATGRVTPPDGVAPTLTYSLVTNNHRSPTMQLYHYLEKSREQLKLLEEERKTAENILARSFPGKQISVVSSSPLPKVPSNASRVDRLIVDQLREQARVASVLRNVEHLYSFPLHANIYAALERHLDAIHVVQAHRKEECVNSVMRQRQGVRYFREDRDILLLSAALKDLYGSTRKSRTALWCTVQMTLLKTASPNVEEQPRTES
ncbi:meiosis-specific coiled-coil domain-containing protein MEIOC isoform X2 [Scleropages formosus]|uniref:Minamoto n=1 Tax=Scleropages formosus TaxID=113540 RepID=A0A8C9V8I4_SCLFO|nr:meiosis-specific coiled-coil domain-containing protein MEIOC isoform X2 [Scleropages formosus]